MFTVNWKDGINTNNTKLQQLSDRFIFLLCFFCAKRKLKTRKTLDGNLNFIQYVDFYKSNHILTPTIAKTEPYKSILGKIDTDEISEELKIQIYNEYKKYINIPFSTKLCIYKTEIVCSIIFLFFATIIFTFYLSPYFVAISKKVKIDIDYITCFPFIPLGIIIILCFVLILFIRKIIALKHPEKDINFFLNNLLSDKTCIKTLREIYKQLENEFYQTNKNTKKRNFSISKEDNSNIIDYSKMSKNELVEIFKKEYKQLFQDYPNFFEILQTCEYKNEKILNDNFEFNTMKYQKTILSFIDFIPHANNHIPDLIMALFKPKYKREQISKKMTEDHSSKNIQDFENFLKTEQKKWNLKH